jgi:hypothetical protein
MMRVRFIPLGQVVLAAGVLVLCGAGNALAQQTLYEVSNAACGEFISSDGNLMPKAAVMFTWLAGYRDGIGALAAVDKRFASVGKMDLNQLGAAVLAYCKVKQDMPMAQAATGVLEMLINAQRGRVINLAAPNPN